MKYFNVTEFAFFTPPKVLSEKRCPDLPRNPNSQCPILTTAKESLVCASLSVSYLGQ